VFLTTISKPYSSNFRRNLLVAYATILGVSAIGFAGALYAHGYRLGSVYAVGALVALALLAERQSIRLTPIGPQHEGMQVSVSSLVFIFSGVVFGPLAAMVVGAAGLIVDFGRPHARWFIWTSSRSIVAGLSGLVAVALGAPNTSSFGFLILAVALASLAEAVGDLALGTFTVVIRGTASAREVLAALGPLLVAATPFHTTVIAVLAYAYRDVSPWSVVLFVLPAFAAQRLFILYREQRQTADQLVAANARLESANLSFATALVATLDARDRYTAGHSAAVAIYSRDIAKRMDVGEDQQKLVHLCGLVHDIGKIGLPAGVLEKPGALTLEERRILEQHSEIGERILAKVDDYAEIAAIVRHHHERVDGNGYPDGRVGDEIPLLSRIIAVADAYNAMTSHRPYREAMPSRVARLRLAQAVETQFDTSVVAAFEAILAGASEDYRSGVSADFALEIREYDRVASEAEFPAKIALVQ
jgi:putative nucleotidyltransferase with HDIG domain